MGFKIVSISDTDFLQALKIAIQYKYVELRLDKLDFTDDDVIDDILCIIEAAELTVLTGIQKYNYIEFPKEYESKIIIDYPVELIDNLHLHYYFNNYKSLKMLSIHHWNGVDSINNIQNIISYLEMILKKYNYKFEYFDFIKIAVKIKSEEEEDVFFDLFNRYKNLSEKLILVPLGVKFQKSRAKSLYMGSPFMFCFVDKPATPCQLSYNRLSYYIDKLSNSK